MHTCLSSTEALLCWDGAAFLLLKWALVLSAAGTAPAARPIPPRSLTAMASSTLPMPLLWLSAALA